jgi:hypothetical protein
MNEAAAILKLYTEDRNSVATVGTDAKPDVPLIPFRLALKQTPPGPLVVQMLVDQTRPNTPQGERNINDWLAGPRGVGGDTRYYPSVPGGGTEPPYSWSTVFRTLDTDADPEADEVQFFIFVNRRSQTPPIGVQTQALHYEVGLPAMDGFGEPVGPEAFSDGQILLLNDGTTMRIKSIDASRLVLVVDRDLGELPPPARPGTPRPIGFAFVPVDPVLGRSPMIAIQGYPPIPLD